MMRIVLCAFIFTIFMGLSSTASPKRCPGQNEVYSTCHSHCPETCKALQDGPTVCAAVCREGCGCKTGYLRNSRGVCVSREAC